MEYQGCASSERNTNSMRGMAMIATVNGEKARLLLLELNSILKERGEVNWIRGIKAAIDELTSEDGTLNETGFENAKSIYKTMNEGGRGFAEYFVWLEDENKRIAANQKLDNLRIKLWEIFDV